VSESMLLVLLFYINDAQLILPCRLSTTQLSTMVWYLTISVVSSVRVSPIYLSDMVWTLTRNLLNCPPCCPNCPSKVTRTC